MVLIQEVKPKRKSLSEVLPRGNRRETKPAPPLPPPPSTYLGATERRRSRRRWLSILAVALFLLSGFFLSRTWARAIVEIEPATFDLALNEALVAGSAGGESGLSFNTITLPSKSGTKSVAASGRERVSRAASGQIIIYNNYDKNPQKLVANTRFASPNGKIYRIREPATVPGLKTVGGQTVPGSIEVTVYADAPGAEYNGAPTDFTIPGFKNDARFDKFFARSKTPLAGGFIGEVPKLSAEAETAARAELRASLTAELLKEARFKIPPTDVLLTGAALLDFRDATDWQQVSPAADEMLIRESATLRGIILPRLALAEKLIDDHIPGFSAAELALANLDDLEAVFDPEAVKNPTEAKSLTFNVKGRARLAAVIDQADLATKLAGGRIEDIAAVLSQTKGVGRSRVIFTPPWIRRVPAEPSKITVKMTTID